MGGLTASFTQKSLPMSADDGIAATFRGSAGPGGRVSVFIRTTDLLYQISSANQPQQLGWPAGYAVAGGDIPVRTGSLRGRRRPTTSRRQHGQRQPVLARLLRRRRGDLVCMATDRRRCVHLYAHDRAERRRQQRARVRPWQRQPHLAGVLLHRWRRLGLRLGPADADGVFTSAPAAISTDGRIVHVVGRGNDNRYWRAYSSDGASTWELWNPIGDGVFSSNPAAAVSADGSSLHIFGRGLDGRIWRAHTPDAGATWDALWGPVGDGIYISSPAVAMSPDGATIHVFVSAPIDMCIGRHQPTADRPGLAQRFRVLEPETPWCSDPQGVAWP